MISNGMKDAGYEYIVIDDCWQSTAMRREDCWTESSPWMKYVADMFTPKVLNSEFIPVPEQSHARDVPEDSGMNTRMQGPMPGMASIT
jgi:hypothetical protein